MVLLECSINFCDPKKRYLSPVVGRNVTWRLDGDKLVSRITEAWVSAQGPNGTLAKLNALGMVNAATMRPFEILSQAEYNRQIIQTCIIL